MAPLEVRGLARSFYGVHALNGVDLDVEAGTITGLLLDEPSAGLAPRAAEVLFETIRAIAAVVGGLGSVPGAVVGALTVGIDEELSLLVLAPADRTAVGFVAILLVLTRRPRGILGERAS